MPLGIHEVVPTKHIYLLRTDRLCGLVKVPSYRYRDPGSIPGATRFLRSSGSGTEST
jgi:hypothetical protein